MLQVMRDKVMGWLGWIIIGLIIITFALFGLGSYLQDSTRIYAAKVNDVEITPRQLQISIQQQRAQLEQMLGDSFDPAMISDDLLRQRALNNLIGRAVLVQGGYDAGMAISDQFLAAQIHAISVFQENGAFSEPRYQQLLSQKGESPAGFESDTRHDLLAEQLVSGVSRTEFITPGEIALAYSLQHQQRDFSYAIVARKSFEDSVEVSDADVQDYFEQHGDELMVPERVRLEYVRLEADTLGKDIPVDDAALEALYEQKKESLKTQEQRRASHILIEVASDADDGTVAEARKKAEGLLARIRDGEDFSALAGQYSADTGSAENGGDLGFFGTGAMVPEFDKTVFSMEKGTVSEPVRTQFGFHLIKLVDVQGSEIPPLEQVRETLIAEIQKQQVDDLFYEKLEHLTNLSYESPDSLDTVEEVMGLKVQTSDWITAAGGPDIGGYPKLLAVVFSDDVLEAGNNSEPVELENGDVIVARVAERTPAQRPPLETVRDQIITTLREQSAARQAREAGEALLEKLAQGASMQDLQGEGILALSEAKNVERSTPGYNPEIMRAAFRLAAPASGETADHGMQLANGDFAVVRLTKVISGDSASMQPDLRQQITESYASLRQAVNFSTLVGSLREHADIVIPSEQEE